MSENWYEEAKQRIAAAKAERDRENWEAMQRQIERENAINVEAGELFKKLVNRENVKDEMQAEIEAVKEKSKQEIEDVKARYAERYGKARWNTETDSLWADVVKNMKGK